MALVKNPTPAFESQDEVAVIDAAAPAQAATKQTISEDAPAAATTAVALAPVTALAVPGQRHQAALQNFEYAFSLEDVRSIGLAAPRVTIDQGGFALDGKELGKELTVQVLSYNPRWLVTAGIPGDEGKALVRFSYDGITIDGDSESVKDYLDFLKKDYPNASIKCYTDLWAIVTGGKDEAADIIGETVVVQLSPQSAGKLKWYQIQQGVKIARGLARDTDSVKITVDRVKMGSDTFGRASFAAA